MTLYLKYRPQKIDELDLESVRNSLKEIVLSGNIPHAFLFSGPKGTGKTSAARIMAKIANCTNLGKDGEPCNTCDSCLSISKGNNIDIIELDAASNRGIDDIRNLKEGIYLAPSQGKKKVYIIDEAHMLTLEAANAFLKTLEEPPDHVMFILATTNPEKLPETVISRLTRVDFTKATNKDISRQLERVAKGEGFKITQEAITLIADNADGSFRDAVKILESISFKNKDIDEKLVESFLPNLSSNTSEFFEILKTKNAQKSLEFIENLVNSGISIKSFSEKILQNIHLSLLAKNNIGEDKLQDFTIEDLLRLNELIIASKLESSPVEQLPFEIAIIKFCGNESQPARNISESNTGEKKTEKKAEEKIETKVEEIKVEVKEGIFSDELWQKLLSNTRDKNVSMDALLRASKPLDFDGKVFHLGVYYKFHKDRLEDTKNTRALEDLCKETFGIDSIKLDFQLIEKPIEKNQKQEAPQNISSLTQTHDEDIIDAAKEIFG